MGEKQVFLLLYDMLCFRRNPERRKRRQPTGHVVPRTALLDKGHSQYGPGLPWTNSTFGETLHGRIPGTFHDQNEFDLERPLHDQQISSKMGKNKFFCYYMICYVSDGTKKDEKDASLQGMWYRGQPCWTKDTPNMVLVFRGQTVLLEKPYMEEYQGLFTIKTSSTWNALCMTNK